MKSGFLRSTVLACTVLLATTSIQGCVGSAIPVVTQIATWVANLIPLVEDVVTLVDNLVSGDIDPQLKLRLQEKLKRVEAAAERVVAAQGKGIAKESHEAMQALTDAYGELVAELEQSGLGLGLGPDETILAAAPGKLVIPTFDALKARAGVE